jgi:hypothetical protein
MTKVLTFLLAFTGSLAFAANTAPPSPAPSSANPTTAYYFTVNLDPRYQFVGTGALSEEDAANAKCYEFFYNPDGKLKEIQYCCAGAPSPDPLLGVARIDFEYAPGIERRWFRDAQGQPVKDIDGVQGEELTLNAAGLPTAVTNLDASGAHIRDNSDVIQYVRTLDDHNRLISGKRIGLFGTAITDKNGYYESRTTYDADGDPMERGNYDSSGNLLNDNDGVALVRTINTIYPDSTLIIQSYFDSSSLATEEKSTGVHQLQRTVDKRGLLLDEAYFDSTGSPIDSRDSDAHDDGIHERRYTYDDRGNQLSESFFDDDGKPVDGRTPGYEYAQIVYKYDDKDRVIEKDYFGDDGTPQVLPQLGAAIIRQDYDDQGNIVRRQFFNGQGQPVRHAKYGAVSIRLKVDGDTTLVTLRDEKDQPTRNPVSGYYAFSYKTGDAPLSPTNTYYDRYGKELSYFPRVSVINPHLHALRTDHGMQWSARLGVCAVALGSLLGAFLALRKSSHTKRRKVYVPMPWERFLGWLAVLFILEGTLRFFMTVYWAWVGYQNGRIGYGIYDLETVILLFFLYRLYRLRVTMRVLNITRDDMHRLIRDYLEKANLKVNWIEARRRYLTPLLDIRVSYFEQKYHAYLALESRGRDGRELAKGAAQYIRGHTGTIQAPVRSSAIAFYYPSVALCYLLLAGTAFYTFWQLVKGF